MSSGHAAAVARRLAAGVARRTPGLREVLRLRDEERRLAAQLTKSRSAQKAAQARVRAAHKEMRRASRSAARTRARADTLRERLQQATAERNKANRALTRLTEAVAVPTGESAADAAAAIDVGGLRARLTAATLAEAFTRGEDVAAAIVDYAHEVAQLPPYPHRQKLPMMLRTLERVEELRPAVHAALVVYGHSLGYHAFAREHLALCEDQAAGLIPVEFAQIRMADDPTSAAEVLGRICRSTTPTPDQWLDILAAIASVGDRDTLSLALGEADRGTAWSEDGRRGLERFARYAGGVGQPLPPVDVVIGVMGYARPDLRASSPNLDDYLQTLATLGHVLRRSGVRLLGDPALVATMTELRERVRSDLLIDGDGATVGVVEFSRDDSHLDDIPPGTWCLASGRHLDADPLGRYGLPYHPNLRPIFVSFHCERRDMLSDDAIEYLRRYGPIGCRDWYTVDLLTHLGIPAFFSGCASTTLDSYFDGPPAVAELPEAFVDAPAPEGSTVLTHLQDRLRKSSLAQNLRAALTTLDTYRVEYGSLTTGSLSCYLSATTLGIPTTFVPRRPFDIGFEGLTGPTADLDAMRTRIRDTLLAPILDAVVSGTPEAEVYALWRSITGPLAEADAARRATAYDLPLWPDDELTDTAAIRLAAWTRPVVREDAAAIYLCFGLDRNYLPQLYTVMDACLAGTRRPIRLQALVRGFDPADYKRFADAFPEVDVTFLPCDAVTIGAVTTGAKRITDSALDRLLLPYLLNDLDKVLYLDLDLLPVGDIGELYDTDVEDVPLAARENDTMRAMGGLVSYAEMANARLSRSEDSWHVSNLVHRRIDAGDYGFNTGVLVMNLARMRAERVLQRCVGFVERFGFTDQFALNVYASGSFLRLDPRWNAWPDRDPTAGTPPAIIHWIGPLKPWDDLQVAHQDTWRAAVAATRRRRGSPEGQGT